MHDNHKSTAWAPSISDFLRHAETVAIGQATDDEAWADDVNFYTVGMLQIQRLLAERKRQLGNKFVLVTFHDSFIKAGRLPVSLIRREMTGLDDEVRRLWPRQRLEDMR